MITKGKEQATYLPIAGKLQFAKESAGKHDFTAIWSSHIPNKIKHFLWILYHQRTMSNHRLHSLGINVNPHCPICGHNREDITHIFFKCYIAASFWNEVQSSSLLANKLDGTVLDSDSWMNCWKGIKNKKCSSILKWDTLFPFCLWQLWKTRNSNVFDKKKQPVSFGTVYSLACEYAAMTSNVKAAQHQI